ncbi:MAG: hypothetical protein PHD04_03190 [Candidatus Pacebacteria bacterium]|nr:hypothetical protein [Candidatus Paceibacterota bacterium]
MENPDAWPVLSPVVLITLLTLYPWIAQKKPYRSVGSLGILGIAGLLLPFLLLEADPLWEESSYPQMLFIQGLLFGSLALVFWVTHWSLKKSATEDARMKVLERL